MSHPPNKRQRSNTSREVANGSPQTPAPALRQIHTGQVVGLGPTSATVGSVSGSIRVSYVHSPGPSSPGLGLGNGTYEVQNPGRPSVNYGQYATGPVNGQVANGFNAAAYQTSANGYGPSYGSPQQQANSFTTTTHYTQGFGNGHPAALQAGHYGHPSASNVPDATYTSVRGMTQQEVPQPYPTPPINSQHSSDPTQMSSNAAMAQQSMSQYGEPFGSQQTTHSTATYRTSTASYPDHSMNSPYNPGSHDTPQNGAGHNSEEMQDDDSEDAQGEMADDSTMIYPHPDLIDAPSPDLSKPPDTKCACKKGRGKKKACMSCVCTKYGRECSSGCACGSACGNPFADLTPFFGSSSMFPKPCGANPCFATWLSNQPNIEELDVDLMVDMILYDDTSWADVRSSTVAFAKWEESWTKARNGKSKKQRDERERLEFELLRGGLGNCNQNDFHGFWYSFCERKWLPTDSWHHCQECRQCQPSDEWHCEKHGQCTTNKICLGCHGNAAVVYPDMMVGY